MQRATHRRGRKGERGFAMLLVFLLAAGIALMLYRQMPREAFESERDKEQMLIDRGEQYKRAIYLYYVQNNRQWPAKIEDLENTNNKRYLRRRYVDPYTGKDEWRLVHTNGSFLTDSLVTPPPAQGTPGANGTPAGALAGTGGASPTNNSLTLASSLTGAAGATTDPNAPPEVNSQVQRRPSDRTLVANSSYQGLPGQTPAAPGTDPGYQPFNPATLPPISLYPNGYNAAPVNAPGGNGTNNNTNQPGNAQGGNNQPGVNQPGFNQPGFNQPGFNQPTTNQPITQPGVPGFTIPGTNSPVTTPGVNSPGFSPNTPAFPGQNSPGQAFPGQPTFPTQAFPGQNPQSGANVPGFNGPGGAPGSQPSNQAVNLINQLLTTPSQPGTTTGQQATSSGGVAGVASTHKGAAIKSYLDRKKYQEWEFVYKANAQTTLQAPTTAANGQNGQGPGGMPGTGGPLGGATSNTTPGSTPNSTPNNGTNPNGFGGVNVPGMPPGFGNPNQYPNQNPPTN